MVEQLSYVIIGNGIAGTTAAEVLRAEDSAATITLVANDPFPVYYRPALKDYLAGRVREDKLWARSTSFHQQHAISLVPERVTGIQAGQHIVKLQSGREIGYHRLLLANGAHASTLKCPGLNLDGVFTLRSVSDYQLVLSHLNHTRRVVVSGSGTLALETLETLRHRGYPVTHLMRKRTLWSEVLDATASDLVLQQERRDGVDVRLEEEIAEITGRQGQVSGVTTTSGAHIPCELVIIAIGIEPSIDFIKSSGIGCGRGVKVDSQMRTNAPDIYAAGDVLETTDATSKRTRVIGQWYPAILQARAAAYSMLDRLDTATPFNPATFYNATFLYGLDFASVGLTHAQGYQEIVAEPRPRNYRKVVLKGGTPVGILALGDRRHVLAFKRAIDHRVDLSPVAGKLFADDFKLNDWLDTQGVPPPLLGIRREGEAAVQRVAYARGNTFAGGTLLTAPPATVASLVPTEPRLPEAFLSQTKVFIVGRQPGVDLHIDLGTVSRRHAEISYVNGQYLLRDMGSANGTFMNDERVEPGSICVLTPGSRLRFGSQVSYTFTMRSAERQQLSRNGVMGADGVTGVTGATMMQNLATRIYDPAAGLVDAPLSQPTLDPDGLLHIPGASNPLPAAIVSTFKTRPTLIVVIGGMTQKPPQAFLLDQGRRITLGRAKSDTITLADITVSRNHAEVFPGPDGWYIRNLHGSNGVVVNRAKLDNPYLLTHGDRITLGSCTLYFIDLTNQQVEHFEDLPEAKQQKQQSDRVVCSKCGAVFTQAARFCTKCGTSLKE